MSRLGPRANVEPITRQPLPYGLLSVLQPRPATGDPHWQSGVQWEALSCAPASGFAVECEPDGRDIPLDAEGNGLGGADPFVVEGTYSCGLDPRGLGYAQDRATEHLLTREEAMAEYAIWTGDLYADNADAQSGFAEDAVNARGSAAAVKLKLAVASLEQFIADNYGSLGVIHMTREAALLGLSGGALLAVRGNGLYTLLGTPVVAGAGYPGTGPDGAAPAAGQTYVYATPALVGYRSDVFPGSPTPEGSFDRANNRMTAVALRTYVVGWDPCPVGYALADMEA